MKRVQLFLLALVAALAVAFIAAKAQEQRPETDKAEKQKVDQHWRVVPNIAPVDLQRQLEILNAEGISINQSEIILVEDKFTIIVSEAGSGECE